MLIDATALMADLSRYVMEVRFTKMDGTSRVMRCTLRKESLPVQEAAQSNQQLLLEGDDPLFRVWDIDARGWRSFHQSQVDTVQALDVV